MAQGTFPFLAIAKRYGYDYGETLQVADILRTGLTLPPRLGHWVPRTIACLAILEANREFAAIQRGEIDWMSGRPV